MQKILNYIYKGRGYGMLLIFAFALLSSLETVRQIKIGINDYVVPVISDAASQFLPIRIENGVIVEPANTKKTYKPLGLPIPIVMDTSVSDFNTDEMTPGIYIAKNKYYLRTSQYLKIIPYSGDLHITFDNFYDIFFSQVNDRIMSSLIIAVPLAFGISALIVLFLAAVSIALGIFLHKNCSFPTRLRLSTVAFIGGALIYYILAYLMHIGNWFVFLVITLAIQYFLMKHMSYDSHR